MSWKDRLKEAVFEKGEQSAGGNTPATLGTTDSKVSSDSSIPKERTSYLGDPLTRPRAKSATVNGGDVAFNASTPDPQFDAELKAALDRATTRGYHELMAQIDVLQDVVPDETRRMQKALESVGRMLHITPDQIAAAIRDRLDILNQEMSQFETGLGAEVSERVSESNESFRNLEASIAQNDAEQKRLEEQLKQLRANRDRMVAERTELQGQIQAINTKAESVRARYLSAYHANVTVLKTQLAKIQPSGN